MAEGKPEFLKGTLDLLILKIVALGPNHGYAIAQRLQQISKDFFQVHQGSLYPALHRLIKRRWISSEAGTSENNRRAKFYELTAAGRKRLREETDSWNRLASAIACALSQQPEET